MPLKRILSRVLLLAFAVLAVAAVSFFAWRARSTQQRGETIPILQNTTGQTGVSSAMEQTPSNISIQLSEGKDIQRNYGTGQRRFRGGS